MRVCGSHDVVQLLSDHYYVLLKPERPRALLVACAGLLIGVRVDDVLAAVFPPPCGAPAIHVMAESGNPIVQTRITGTRPRIRPDD